MPLRIDELYLQDNKHSKTSKELLNWLYDHCQDLSNTELLAKMQEIVESKLRGLGNTTRNHI